MRRIRSNPKLLIYEDAETSEFVSLHVADMPGPAPISIDGMPFTVQQINYIVDWLNLAIRDVDKASGK
jgi:hypothetical protein